MITLKSPPLMARRVLHLNCSSSSPGGKDYVLVEMSNGTLWACNGPAATIRNGGGAVQQPKKSWYEMENEKRGKGYREVGSYSNGKWWGGVAPVYASVQNIPITPSQPQPQQAQPSSSPPVRKQQQQSPLSVQYPIGKLTLDLPVGAESEWFFFGGPA